VLVATQVISGMIVRLWTSTAWAGVRAESMWMTPLPAKVSQSETRSPAPRRA
jgi:hypothetical protein